jgi:hypothetical protein
MIYITGDTHRDLNWFKHPMFRKIKKRDTLIICGDFGFIWDGSKKEQKILKWLGKRRFDVLFADGVHENFEELEKYEVEDWNGGKTRKISGRLRQLMRGCVFSIGDKRVLTFGGGQSDRGQSGKHNPSEEDFKRAEESLKRYDYNIDYIISYEPPTQIAEFLNLGSNQHDSDIISHYLDEINRKTNYERWFFGKHHINKIVTSKYFAMFDNVVNADYDPITKR